MSEASITAPQLFDGPTQPEALPTACPWCNGTGLRIRAELRSGTEREPCVPCLATGEAARWTGPAADAWRARTSRAEAVRRARAEATREAEAA